MSEKLSVRIPRHLSVKVLVSLKERLQPQTNSWDHWDDVKWFARGPQRGAWSRAWFWAQFVRAPSTFSSRSIWQTNCDIGLLTRDSTSYELHGGRQSECNTMHCEGWKHSFLVDRSWNRSMRCRIECESNVNWAQIAIAIHAQLTDGNVKFTSRWYDRRSRVGRLHSWPL